MTGARPLSPEILAAVVARPDDDEPRLRYADVLAAAGRGQQAEFIRLQCESSRIWGGRTRSQLAVEEVARASQLSDRARELVKDHAYDWSPGLTEAVARLDAFSYTRGFIEHLSVLDPAFLGVSATAFASCPLRSLSVLGQHTASVLERLADTADTSRLRTLTVSGAWVGGFAAGRGGFEGVESLSLLRLTLPPSAAALAASNRLPSLRSLYIQECGTDAATMEALAAGPALSRLETLQVRDERRFGDAGAVALAASPLAGRLRELTLHKVGLTKAAGRVLAGGGPWPRLEALDLSMNALSAQGIAALVRSAGMPALRRLELKDTGVTRTAVEALARGPLGQTLEVLVLSQNKKVDDAALAVLARPEALPRLRLVRFLKTAVGESGTEALEALAARLPRIDPSDQEEARERAATAVRMAAAKAARAAAPSSAPPPAAALVQVPDANLKLTLIEMLRRRKLLPPFDKEAFWELELGKRYDEDSAVHDRVDKRVLQHLTGLPITRAMAEAVDVLNWQADNKVHSDVWQHWDGEDDTFNLHDLRGIEQFPNIREIYILYGNSIADWSPAARLPRLEEISLHGGAMKDLGVLASAPSLRRVRLEGVEGHDQPVNRAGVESLRARGIEVDWS